MKKTILWLLAGGLLVQNAYAEDEVVTKISTGLFYASGQSQTFGSSDSTLYSVPFLVSWKYNRFRASLSTAYLNVDNRFPDLGTTVKANGMGDTTVSLGYDLTEAPWLTLKVKHKFATGNKDDGLSTGKDDTSVQLDYFAPVNTKTSAFATLGYKFVGKVDGYTMQDSAYGSVGVAYLFPTKTSVGISADYRQTTYTNLKDQTGGSLFVSQKVSKAWSVSGFGSYDNTETTSLGLTVTRKF
ncbi:MAG: hypothetical protein R3219_08265 [Hydrogenovibrio sp.]|nr:hypothetical protein [Hydrogenovibrio sp.]